MKRIATLLLVLFLAAWTALPADAGCRRGRFFRRGCSGSSCASVGGCQTCEPPTYRAYYCGYPGQGGCGCQFIDCTQQPGCQCSSPACTCNNFVPALPMPRGPVYFGGGCANGRCGH